MYTIYYTTIKHAQPITPLTVKLEEIPKYVSVIHDLNPDCVIIIKPSDKEEESSFRVFYDK